MVGQDFLIPIYNKIHRSTATKIIGFAQFTLEGFSSGTGATNGGTLEEEVAQIQHPAPTGYGTSRAFKASFKPSYEPGHWWRLRL